MINWLLVVPHDGPHVVGLVEAVADAEVSQPGLQLGDELVEHGRLNEQLGARGADLIKVIIRNNTTVNKLFWQSQ